MSSDLDDLAAKPDSLVVCPKCAAELSSSSAFGIWKYVRMPAGHYESWMTS